MFQQHQLDLVPEIELSSNDLLLDLAKIGLGIAFVPDYCVKDKEQDLFFVETEESLPLRELAIVHNDEQIGNNAALINMRAAQSGR